jgi:hypothetical protein
VNLPPEIEKERRQIEKYAREYGLDKKPPTRSLKALKHFPPPQFW